MLRIGAYRAVLPGARDPGACRPVPMTTTDTPPRADRPVFTGIGQALGTDYFLVKSELTKEEIDYLERSRRYVHEEVLPVINGYWERAEVPVDLYRRLGELGLVG